MKPRYMISGIVEYGNNRGKKLGFPTINMCLTDKIPDGIYLSQTQIEQKKYNSLTFIGAAKTFNEKETKAETFLFDFSKDIYGIHVEIVLIKKIRNNKYFDSTEQLIHQMDLDKKIALEYFTQNKS